MSNAKEFGFDTLALHAGYQPESTTGSRAVPIYQTSSFVFDNTEHAASLFALQDFGNIYTRINNPTNAVLEERITSLEKGSAAVAVSSGMSAQFLTFFTLCEAGDEVIASAKLYGGTYTQFDLSFKKLGIKVVFVDPNDIQALENAINDKTKALYTETIGNPTGDIPDFESWGDIAKKHKIPFIVDNTFATPFLFRPLEHGANIVLHSLTKFLGGHGNSIGGIVVDGGNFEWDSSDKFECLTKPSPYYHGLKFWETFRECAFAVKLRTEGLRDLGTCLSPMNAFLLLQGIETLSVRMERHIENAKAVAEFLEKHNKVAWVKYSGLESSPFHIMAQKYTKGSGGAVFCFGVKGGREAGKQVIDNVELFSHLANVGDSRSLIIHPASTTHQQLNDEDLVKAGINPEMIRLSIGIESVQDLLQDLDQALEKI